MSSGMKFILVVPVLTIVFCIYDAVPHETRPRVIVTSDGEIDDECSMVRFLLYANEWDIDGIITSSSQYHWQGHNWAGDNWIDPYLEAYAKACSNLVHHDSRSPSSDYLEGITFLGNIAAEGETQDPSIVYYIESCYDKLITDDGEILTYDTEKYNIDIIKSGTALIICRLRLPCCQSSVLCRSFFKRFRLRSKIKMS